MVVPSPPLQMGEQVGRLLRRGPRAASQRSYSMAHRQIHPFNERGVQPS
jgi:hypothetical protein